MCIFEKIFVGVNYISELIWGIWRMHNLGKFNLQNITYKNSI
jgi:hypothetical protein